MTGTRAAKASISIPEGLAGRQADASNYVVPG
jgi:hypothetical protein